MPGIRSGLSRSTSPPPVLFGKARGCLPPATPHSVCSGGGVSVIRPSLGLLAPSGHNLISLWAGLLGGGGCESPGPLGCGLTHSGLPCGSRDPSEPEVTTLLVSVGFCQFWLFLCGRAVVSGLCRWRLSLYQPNLVRPKQVTKTEGALDACLAPSSQHHLPASPARSHLGGWMAHVCGVTLSVVVEEHSSSSAFALPG